MFSLSTFLVFLMILSRCRRYLDCSPWLIDRLDFCRLDCASLFRRDFAKSFAVVSLGSSFLASPSLGFVNVVRLVVADLVRLTTALWPQQASFAFVPPEAEVVRRSGARVGERLCLGERARSLLSIRSLSMGVLAGSLMGGDRVCLGE